MSDRQTFTFNIDAEAQKLVSIQQSERTIEVTVRIASDVVYDDSTTEIRNAIDPQMRTDEHGLIVEWKQPMIPGWDWLTFSRRQRF